MNTQKKIVPWWLWLLLINAFLILASILDRTSVTIPHSWRLIAPFQLGVENNFGAWWSGVTLAACSFLFFELFSTKSLGLQKAWLILFVILFLFSFDEISSIHERIGNWSVLLPLLGIAGMSVVYALKQVFSKHQCRAAGYLILGAFLLYGSVVFQEYLEHHLNWPKWMLPLRLGIEEGTELFATFLLFAALVKIRSLQIRSFAALVPRPWDMALLPLLMALLLSTHLLGCFLVPNYVDLSDGRGNPLNYIPMLLPLIAAAWNFWEWKKLATLGNVIAAIFLVAVSAHAVYDFIKLIPKSGALDTHLLFTVLALSFIVLYFKNIQKFKDIILLFFSVILLILQFLLHNNSAYFYPLSGITAYILSVLFAPDLLRFEFAVDFRKKLLTPVHSSKPTDSL